MHIPDSIGFYNAWLLAAVYLVLNFTYILLLPKYKLKDFIYVPRVKYISALNHLLYYAFLFFCIFSPLKTGSVWFFVGLFVLIAGLFFYSFAMFSFAITEYNRPTTKGIYRYSRHPVYVSFFMIACGISIASLSFVLLSIAVLHFLLTLKMMKAEETECKKKYKTEYEIYKSQTNRIIQLNKNKPLMSE